jgi:hypothetical protein
MLTQEYVQSVLRYEDGHLWWRNKTRNHHIDHPAGTVNGKGYRQICINYKIYTVHRLVFLYHHGWLPKYIDHINGVRTDNRIENLRACTHQQNCFNSAGYTSTGVKGVTWHKSAKKWQAQLSINGRNTYLGSFKTIEEAAEAVERARQEHHGAFARS